MPEDSATTRSVGGADGPAASGRPADAGQDAARAPDSDDATSAPQGRPDAVSKVPVVEEAQPEKPEKKEDESTEPGAGGDEETWQERYSHQSDSLRRKSELLNQLRKDGILDEDYNRVSGEQGDADQRGESETPEVEQPKRQVAGGSVDIDGMLRSRTRQFWNEFLEDIRLEHGEIGFEEARVELQARGIMPGGPAAQSARSQPQGQYLMRDQAQEMFSDMLRQARSAGMTMTRQLANTRARLGNAFMEAPVNVRGQEMRREDWLAQKSEETGMSPEELLIRHDQNSLMDRLGEIAFEKRAEEHQAAARRNGGTPEIGPYAGPPMGWSGAASDLPPGQSHDPGLDEGPGAPKKAPGY